MFSIRIRLLAWLVVVAGALAVAPSVVAKESAKQAEHQQQAQKKTDDADSSNTSKGKRDSSLLFLDPVMKGEEGQRVGPMRFTSSFRLQTVVDSNPWFQEASSLGGGDSSPYLSVFVAPTAGAFLATEENFELGFELHSSILSMGGIDSLLTPSLNIEPAFLSAEANGGLRVKLERFFDLSLLGRVVASGQPASLWKVQSEFALPLLDDVTRDKNSVRQLAGEFEASLRFDFLLLLELRYRAYFERYERASHFELTAPGKWWLLSTPDSAALSSSMNQEAHHFTGRVGVGMFELDEFGPIHLFVSGEARLGNFRSDGFYAAAFVGVDGRIFPWKFDLRVGMDDESTILGSAALRCERRRHCFGLSIARELLFFEEDLLSHRASMSIRFRKGFLFYDFLTRAGLLNALHDVSSEWTKLRLHSEVESSIGVELGPMTYRVGGRLQTFHAPRDLDKGRVRVLLFFDARVGEEAHED